MDTGRGHGSVSAEACGTFLDPSDADMLTDSLDLEGIVALTTPSAVFRRYGRRGLFGENRRASKTELEPERDLDGGGEKLESELWRTLEGKT